MTRRPDEDKPDPPGGRAAERLRDFLSRRSSRDDEPGEEPDAEEQRPDTEEQTVEEDPDR
jgi:hypothetical protein